MITECFIQGSYWVPCEVLDAYVRDSDGNLHHLVRVWDEDEEEMKDRLVPIEDVRM